MAHQKHAKLTKPIGGKWGRTEIALLGAPCSEIKELSAKIIKILSSEWQIAYVDADHNPSENTEWSALDFGASNQLTNKISHFSTQSKISEPQFINDADLVIVNGNHFKAEVQIAWVHPKKSLEKKLDRLDNVDLVVLDDEINKMPDYLTNHLTGKKYITVKRSDSEAIIAYLIEYLRNSIPPLSGLVLIGGDSTRMNADKSQLVYHDNISQQEYLTNLLNGFCDGVFISVRDGQQADKIGSSAITDKFIGLGPYGGILSAFQQNPNTAWLVVAVDLPFLDKATVQQLIGNRNIHKAATCFIDRNNEFPEPLITIWEPRAYPILLEFLAKGYSCPRKALINSDVEIINNRDLLALTNVNTPAEMESALMKIVE